jgi:predicted DNA-binding transcriptional regulator AlpA
METIPSGADVAREIDLQVLAREIAARLDPIALLDAEDVGALLKCCSRQVKERYARTKDFPKPVPMGIEPGHRGRPRWQRADIAAWIEGRKMGARKKAVGRPRKAVVPDSASESVQDFA